MNLGLKPKAIVTQLLRSQSHRNSSVIRCGAAVVDSLWLQPQVTVPNMRQAEEQRRIDDSCMTFQSGLFRARLPQRF